MQSFARSFSFPSKLGAWLVCLAALAAVGCGFGREVRGPADWPSVPLTEPHQPRKIVVAKFFEYEFNTSATTSHVGNTEITNIRESATVKDISGELAAALKRKGTAAMAKSSVKPSDLAGNDLWARGVVQWTNCKRCEERQIAAALFMVPTVCIIGGVLPFPFSVGYGLSAKVRVEVVNAREEIVATHEDEISFGYKAVYAYPVVSNPAVAPDRPEMLDRLAAAVAKLNP